MTRALLEQALEAMRGPVYGGPVFSEEIRSVMKAIDKHLAQPQGEPVAAAGEDLAIYQSIADNYFKSIRPAHTEAEVQSILRNRRAEFGEYEAHVRRILGVPAP